MTPETPISEPQTGGAPIRVLLVDDQRFIGLALERLFATEPDIELHWCECALDAVERATALSPTMILQDLVMPGVDGLTLVGRYRQNPATARTPVIVLSGNEESGSRAKSLAAGADDYLIKLPAKDELIACVRRHANGHGSAAATPAPAAATQSHHGEQTLDREVVALFCDRDGGLSTFARTLIDQFTRDAEAQIAAMADALRAGNSDTLRNTAHSLKGSSLTVGAKRLGALCRDIEESLRTNPERPIALAQIQAVDAEFLLVRKAFGEL